MNKPSVDDNAFASARMMRIANNNFKRSVHGQYVVGLTGTGKSWLACALGNRACRDGFSVLYKRVPRLFADLAQARGEGRLARLIAALERVNLLILDLCAARSDVERYRSPRY
ncbi:DNA replication protein DnaC [Bradyrhizobium sp. USDA 10063]